MPDVQPGQTPEQASPGWMPTRSTVNGALLGGAIAQIVVAAWNSFVPAHQLDAMTIGAVNTICVFAAGYLDPQGGRK